MTNSKPNKRSIIAIIVILVVAIGVLLTVNTDPVTADQNAATGNDQANTTETMTSTLTNSALPSLLRMVSALVIVIACIYGGIFLLRRLMGQRHGRQGQSNILEVLETTSVAPKKTVSLIRVAGKSVLVGITETGMSVLTELSPEETAAILDPVEDLSSPQPDFANTLGNAWNRLRRTTPAQETKAALEG
ncbi:MAG: flagellar biosynthetic protein FliO [candidate division Zixibacteria bacterium]|nr:flagellar biosynthetic protein FliO [candidate division Zixibacteria bacterium]